MDEQRCQSTIFQIHNNTNVTQYLKAYKYQTQPTNINYQAVRHVELILLTPVLLFIFYIFIDEFDRADTLCRLVPLNQVSKSSTPPRGVLSPPHQCPPPEKRPSPARAQRHLLVDKGTVPLDSALVPVPTMSWSVLCTGTCSSSSNTSSSVVSTILVSLKEMRPNS